MFYANDELLECSGRSADQSTSSSSSCETMSLLETSITNFRTLVSYIRLLFLFCYKHWKVSLILATIFTLSIYVIGVWATLLLLLLFLLYNLYTACDALLYNPNLPKDSRTNVLTPKSYDLDYERHMLETEDKVNIHVQLIKRTKTEESVSAPTIIYLHGNAGNIGHRLVNAIELYRAIKCNIVLMEYRGFGLSEGKPTEKGLYKDVCATLAFLNKRNDICKSKVILFGRSLGGAVAIGTVHKILTMANSEELIHPAALIIENTFTSVPDISRFLFTGNSRSCFARLFRIVPDWFYKSRYNSIGKISKISLPTLFLSGLSDELIPQSMMSRLYNKSNAIHKEMHKFESGSHNFTWKCSGYYNAIEEFLANVLDQTNAKLVGESEVQLHITNEKSPLITNSVEQCAGSHKEVFHSFRSRNPHDIPISDIWNLPNDLINI